MHYTDHTHPLTTHLSHTHAHTVHMNTYPILTHKTYYHPPSALPYPSTSPSWARRLLKTGCKMVCRSVLPS
ncbi:hypothetical protein EON63_22700 [archaeon]|nr:MAG: hypothetical protein EON63_22700 [archaeon]